MNVDDGDVFGLKPGDFAAKKHEIKLVPPTSPEEIKIDQLKKVAEHLQQNLEMVNDMISVPHVICSIQAAELNRMVWHIEASLKSGISCPVKADEAGKQRFKEEMNKIQAEKIEPKIQEIVDQVIKEGDSQAIRLLKDGDLNKAYKAILRSGLVLTWCSLEVFMRDLWETSLNIGGKSIIQNVLKGLDKLGSERNSTGIQGKSISLEYLAKFNYDLSNNLGTVLLNKYDFTSLNGITEAYVAAFPRSETIKQALANVLLSELAAKRNVIVHNSCIIDGEYCSKLSLGKELIGQELIIRIDDITRLGAAVVDEGIKVLSAASSIIAVG